MVRESREDRRLIARAETLWREDDRRPVREEMEPHAKAPRRRTERVGLDPRDVVRGAHRSALRRIDDDQDADDAALVRSERAGRRMRPLEHRRAETGDPLRELRAVARSLLRLLGDHAVDEDVERVRDLGPDLAHAPRVLDEDLREHGHEVRAAEEPLAGEALEEHAAEGEDVDGRRDFVVAARLLGRDEARRADEHSRERQRARGDALARDPEVDHLNVGDLPRGQKEIARLEIAMNETARVQAPERVGHAACNRDRIVDGQRPRGEALLKVHPFEPRHDEVRRTVCGDAMAHVADDVRVRDRREDLDLLREAIGRSLLAALQHLEGDGAARRAIVRVIDHAHAAGSCGTQNLEAVGDDMPRLHDHRRIRETAAPDSVSDASSTSSPCGWA